MRRTRLAAARATGAAILAAALLAGCGPRPDRPLPGVSHVQAPPGPAPADVTALGRRLFLDASLSASGRMSCGTCHDPAHAYGPPDGGIQFGGPALDRQGLRTVPSLRYVLARTPRYAKQYQADPVERAIETDSVPAGGFGRDGRFDTLHDQARGPLLDPREMANADTAAAVERLRESPNAAEFRRVYGPDALADPASALSRLLAAIERFELDDPSFHPYSSKFDRRLQGRATFTAREERGLAAFTDPARGNCASCHPAAPGANGAPPLFTDFSFEALGAPRNRALAANADPRFHDLGLCGPLRTDQAAPTSHCGMFKTPSLRNVAARRAFMHNGVFTDLATAVRFYAERDTKPAAWYPKGAAGRASRFDDLPPALRDNVDVIDAPMDRREGDAPALSASEVGDIVAFLGTLTDDDVAPPRPARAKTGVAPPRRIALAGLSEFRRQSRSPLHSSKPEIRLTTDPIRFNGRAPRYTARNTVAFDMIVGGGVVLCEIAPAALRDHFGATGPTAVELVRAFENGRTTIEAVAARVLPARIAQGAPAVLQSVDFTAGGSPA